MIKKGTRCFSYCYRCGIRFEYKWKEGTGDKDFFREHFRHGKFTAWADTEQGRLHARFAGAPI